MKEFLTKHKITVIIIVALVIILIAGIVIFLCATGGKLEDVLINTFGISEEGNTMTINILTSDENSHVRKMKIVKEDDVYYITFYSTFGINSTIGEKKSFDIDLSTTCNYIYVYGKDGEFELVLKRNTSTNKWSLQYK